MRRESLVIPLWRSWRVYGACAVLALGVIGVKSVKGQCMYEVVAEVKNPTCNEGSGNGTITAMNDHNVVVGVYALNCGFDVRPFMWSQETGFVALPLPPGVTEAEPRDINNNGEIVGWLTRIGVSGRRAFLYQSGVWTELPPTGDGIHSEAFGINDDGWVCGYRDTDNGPVAFRWRGDIVEELASPIGLSALGYGINSSATTTGEFQVSAGSRAFEWTERQAEEIPSPAHTLLAQGFDISDSNVIVGGAIINPPGEPLSGRAWLFENSSLIELGFIAGTDSCRAIEINDAYQIVGRCSAPIQPVLWQHGQVFDLESLIVNPPLGKNLSTAQAINNNGWIAIDGVVLRPIDRPLGDVNIDCTVDERDLIAVLEDWGPDKLGHLADIVTNSTFQPPGDGVVDGADLAVVLGNWSISTKASATNRRR